MLGLNSGERVYEVTGTAPERKASASSLTSGVQLLPVDILGSEPCLDRQEIEQPISLEVSRGGEVNEQSCTTQPMYGP
jgi:hypothetical protein